MPFRTSNNAVTMALSGSEECVYSFMGIDSTKHRDGIHLRSFKYTPSTDSWIELEEAPDSLGKIAAGASTVNGIIYLMGGYHVFSGPPYELSSNKVHRFDPSIDSFLSDGTDIPVAIDDHVQAVWRDSLIFLVTGWSDVDYVPSVQIYDPAADSWQEGTSVPNGIAYEAFGASGVIIGDTIYYHGGSVGGSFSASGRLRKGVIDPSDPSQITWSEIGNFNTLKGYRSAAVEAEGKALWIGGSGVTYNYNGIAYNGSGGVPALDRVMIHEPSSTELINTVQQPYAVMDLRGAAELSDGSFIICGGMGPGQYVSDKTYRISYIGPSGTDEVIRSEKSYIFPNPASLDSDLIMDLDLEKSSVIIYDSQGHSVSENLFLGHQEVLSPRKLGIKALGLYLIHCSDRDMWYRLLIE